MWRLYHVLTTYLIICVSLPSKVACEMTSFPKLAQSRNGHMEMERDCWDEMSSREARAPFLDTWKNVFPDYLCFSAFQGGM